METTVDTKTKKAYFKVWVLRKTYSEIQARRILQDYDKIPFHEPYKSISFVTEKNDYVDFVFWKHTDGSVLMTRVDYNR